ncbi:AT-rich interactive domain-containing protein 1 [Acorus calamus]|uniref:AT-rich interactive domain-containing protein 1 n=1 Tax=Acorus calamus TaxID=4465 RepID=A0AAV9CQA3_ACOCL|nr:AT-rich interactive domain-containing protein 1 [Acorus calamus]
MEQWAIVPARPSPASDADILPNLSPFDQLISAVHEGILWDGEVRPIPPMLGDGQMVDLLKLHLSVRERGGYDSVSESGSWATVAQAVGLDSAVAASVKLVFVKYLGAVDRLMGILNGDMRVELPRLEGKREGVVMEMLEWVRWVALGPGELCIVRRSDGTERRVSDKDGFFKWVLAVRKAIYVKKIPCIPAERYLVRKRQKTHPSWYEDPASSNSPGLRCSPRLQLQQLHSNYCSSSDTSSVHDKPKLLTRRKIYGETFDVHFCKYKPEKHVPVGRHHQAEVQDFVVISSQISNDPDDLKWLGTPIWPPMKEENRLALHGGHTGKGRPDSCGCKHSGSVGCIKFHVAEERLRVKFELGSAFSKWKFDNMGEEVALSWTVAEQEKFKDIVRSNRASLGKDFWGEIHHSFPKRSRQSIVSYYFNVFIMSRRAYQNRFDPHNIDSDDDESEVDDFACDKYFCKNTDCMDLGE